MPSVVSQSIKGLVSTEFDCQGAKLSSPSLHLQIKKILHVCMAVRIWCWNPIWQAFCFLVTSSAANWMSCKKSQKFTSSKSLKDIKIC